MLTKTTLERLRSFHISGFVDALLNQGNHSGMTFEDRMTLLVDAEHTRRLNAKATRMLKQARLPASAASVEDVDFAAARALDKGRFLELLSPGWLSTGQNVIITGPTGVGKTFLASVITKTLCLHGHHTRYQRMHHWLAEFLLLEEKRRFPQAVAGLRKVPLLVFDEWLRDSLTQTEARLLLDLFDDRYGRLSCMFISQFPVPDWHSRFNDPTIADAVLDRIVNRSVRFNLQGDSLRRSLQPQPTKEHVAALR